MMDLSLAVIEHLNQLRKRYGCEVEEDSLKDRTIQW